MLESQVIVDCCLQWLPDVASFGVHELQEASVASRSQGAPSQFAGETVYALRLQPYPQKVVRPPWHPPQPPSQEVVGALGMFLFSARGRTVH